jgi:hypothetical protein
MTGLGDYPPGAENDSRAPWNELDEQEECSECRDVAVYVQSVWSRTPLDTPINYNYYYCQYHFDLAFEDYLEEIEDNSGSKESFMKEENIEML